MITEKTFMPKSGTLIHRVMTIEERKWVAKLDLAKFVAVGFNAELVRFKYHGAHYFLGYDLTNKKFFTKKWDRAKPKYFENLTSVVKFLMRFDVTTILKINKLGKQCVYNQKSVEGTARKLKRASEAYKFNAGWRVRLKDDFAAAPLQITNQIKYVYGNPATA